MHERGLGRPTAVERRLGSARAGGDVIGTLSVFDTKPHEVSEVELANLEDLAALVMVQLDLRRETARMTGEMDSPIISSVTMSLPDTE